VKKYIKENQSKSLKTPGGEIYLSDAINYYRNNDTIMVNNGNNIILSNIKKDSLKAKLNKMSI